MLTIVRHAETEENRRDISQSQEGGTISRKGKRQLEKLAKQLSTRDFDVILSSDSRRTMETARAVSRSRKIRIIPDLLLRERSMGCFVGKPRREFWDARAKSGLSKTEYRPPGGENYIDLSKRAQRFLARVLKRKEKSILIVTHGGFIKMLYGELFGIAPEKAFLVEFGNAGITTVSICSKPKLLQKNYRRHLEGCR